MTASDWSQTTGTDRFLMARVGFPSNSPAVTFVPSKQQIQDKHLTQPIFFERDRVRMRGWGWGVLLNRLYAQRRA